jgi:maleylacetoacetate isomerase/maleylpyruvate isomerase
MQTILYDYWRSSAAYRVRIALALKGIAFDQVPVNLLAGEQAGAAYAATNGQGLVPFLVDGDIGISQSLAIIEYLEETHPDPALLPKEPAARARVRAAAMVVACDIHPINNLRVLKYLKRDLDRSQEQIDGWVRHWVAAGFATLEQMAVTAGGPYLCGPTVTIADICLVPQMFNARRVATDLSPYPTLCAIDARLQALPAFRAAHPEKQPDAVV